jgi:TldD protein
MRVDACDRAVEAVLETARAADLYVIARIQDCVDRRLTLVDRAVDRQRTTTLAGIGVHAFTREGAVGFASVDDLRPEAARDAVRRAGLMARAAGELGATRTLAPFGLAVGGRVRLEHPRGWPAGHAAGAEPSTLARTLIDAQDALAEIDIGAERTVRTTHHVVDEEWRVVRSDGTDVSFETSRAVTRHDLSGRLDGTLLRAAAHVAGVDGAAVVAAAALARLARRLGRSARDAVAAHGVAPPRSGSYRLVIDPALAKGLAHEAIGHLCESDVDGSVLMRNGRLRLGEQLARQAVSVVDGPLPGDYAQQPISANGLPRETVRLIDRGVLRGGLGDPFSHADAGIDQVTACRAAGFRDRPTPRMTNIRIEIEGAATLAPGLDPDLLTPDDVAAALRRLGLLDPGRPTLYVAGYRGGQAQPRRGDFVFGADVAYDLAAGGAPRGPVSFSGLAERALASIMTGIGPLCTDAIGTCGKDGSRVTSSGGSHAVLVLDADPDLVVTAAS